MKQSERSLDLMTTDIKKSELEANRRAKSAGKKQRAPYGREQASRTRRRSSRGGGARSAARGASAATWTARRSHCSERLGTFFELFQSVCSISCV